MNTGGISDRKRSGEPRLVRTPQIINAVRSRIKLNPVLKQKIHGSEMDIAPRIMNRIVKQDMGLRAFKRKTLKENRTTNSRLVLPLYGKSSLQSIQ